MNFFKKIINKPITICMIILVLVCVGVFSVRSMPVTLLPDLNIPILGVTVVYPGASATTVENDVTTKLETTLSSISKVTEVKSYSLENASFIVLSFEYETSLKEKEQEIKEKIASANLPSSCYDPEIVSFDFNSSALATIALTCDSNDINELKEISNTLSNKFSLIEGVGNVQIKGLPTEKVSVKPIIGLESTTLLIVEALSKSSLDIPLGIIKTSEGKISVRNNSEAKELIDLANTSVSIPLKKDTWQMLDNIKQKIELIKTSYADVLNTIEKSKIEELLQTFNKKSKEELEQTIAKIIEYKDKIDNISDEKYNPNEILKKYSLIFLAYGIKLNINYINFFRNMDKNELVNLLDELMKIKDTNLTISLNLINFISSIDFSQITYDNNDTGHYITSFCNVTKINEEEVEITPNLTTIDIEQTNESYSYYNDHLAVILEVYGKSGSNTSQIVKNVKSIINENSQKDINVTLLDDQAEFIDDSISNVLSSILIGGVLAILVIFFFLIKVRSSLVIAITMPLSVLTALIVLYVKGITLNMVSLGGLAVGIGMLVDNSIVVIEAITKRRENDHMDVASAALHGTMDVAGSLFASTLTTVCVFIPIMFTKGLTKEIFTDLSWAVILSLTFSLLVAILVIPSLYALFCKGKKEEEIKPDKFTTKLEGKYQKILEKALTKKTIIVVSMIVIFVASIGLVLTRGIEFLPPSDKGLIEVTLNYDSQIDIEEANNKTLTATNLIKENINDISSIAVSVGKLGLIKMSNGASIRIQLNDKRKKTSEVAEDIRKLLNENSNYDVTVKEVDGIVASITSGFNDLTINVTGSDEETLKQIATELETELLRQKGITGVKNNLTTLQKEYKIKVDKTKCLEYGIDYQNLIMMLRVGLAGYETGTIEDNAEEVKIQVIFNNQTITSYDDLATFVIGFKGTQTIKLSDVASINQTEEKVLILKDDGKLSLQLNISTYGIDTGTASREIKKVTKQVLSNYPDVMVKESGVQAYLNDAFKGLAVALVISIFLLYAVMACQFESLSKPLIIMASIPLTFTGAFLALTITNVTLNIVSFIGVIMLMGVIVNNAIIMLGEIKRLKDEDGLSHYNAVVKGCTNRLRPILMTTLTTVLALIPLSLGLGRGGELMQPMGIVVIGGLLIGTIVTLVLIPSIYCGVKKIKKEQ